MKNKLAKIALAVLGLAIALFLSCADNPTPEYPSIDVFFSESSDSETNSSSSSPSEQPGSSDSDASSSSGEQPGSSGSTPSSGSNSSSSLGSSSSESQEQGSFDGTYFTDPRDGKKYKCEYAPEEGGGKLWMSENLNYSRNNTLGYCYNANMNSSDPHKNASTCNNGFGRLYDTWETAMDGNTQRGLCPYGWHIPGEAEWKEIGAAATGNGSILMSRNFYIYSGKYDYIGFEWADKEYNGFYWTSESKDNFAQMGIVGANYFKWQAGTMDEEAFSIRCVADDDMFGSSPAPSDQGTYCEGATKIITGNNTANTTGAVCFKIIGYISGWTGSNTSGRTCKVNGGNAVSAGGSSSAVNSINGYVYINCSAGSVDYFAVSAYK